MGLGQGCWQTTRGNQGHSANVLQAQEKTNHASCLASCPLHLYLQHHCAWITTPLINWTLGRKYTWTHTHRGTYCMHDRKLPRTSSSSEIIIMITKACYVFSTEVTSPRTRGGGATCCRPESYQALQRLKIHAGTLLMPPGVTSCTGWQSVNSTTSCHGLSASAAQPCEELPIMLSVFIGGMERLQRAECGFKCEDGALSG